MKFYADHEDELILCIPDTVEPPAGLELLSSGVARRWTAATDSRIAGAKGWPVASLVVDEERTHE